MVARTIGEHSSSAFAHMQLGGFETTDGNFRLVEISHLSRPVCFVLDARWNTKYSQVGSLPADRIACSIIHWGDGFRQSPVQAIASYPVYLMFVSIALAWFCC